MINVSDTINKIVEENANQILEALNYIWSNPETGYREKKTSAYMEKAFEDMGYELTKAGDIPGFYTVVDTGRPGPEILLMAELDALICPEHKEADIDTSAAHVCGHCAQCAALIGVAASLKEKSILDNLCGKIRLCAVPAEELLEIEYRDTLRNKGIIKFFGGKPEFMRRGYFEGCDMAILVHTTSASNFFVNKGSVGCRAKIVTYKGKSAHAGGSPWDGVNALYAANQGLNAINSIRETFKEADVIRVHPIITHGGNAVNAIPDRVIIESYVRGSSFDAINEANAKVNRALCGAALSLGANINIYDIPGYAPYINSPDLIAVASEALAKVLPNEKLNETGIMASGSTDIGDLSHVMPIIHPYAPGAVGTSHGDDYYIENPQMACINSAKWQLSILTLLLENNAERVKKIKENYNPAFKSQKDYCDYLESIYTKGDRIEYIGKEARVILG